MSQEKREYEVLQPFNLHEEEAHAKGSMVSLTEKEAADLLRLQWIKDPKSVTAKDK